MKPDPSSLVELPGIEFSEALRDRICAEGNPILLSFSGGKDSIGAWLALLRGKVEIIPYYLYCIPGLEFIEEQMEYFEKFFGARIIRLPHQALYRWIGNFTFTPPERCKIIEDANWPQFDRKQLLFGLKQDLSLPDETWCATGVRASDSIMRRLHFQKHGCTNETDRIFYPGWDWKKARLMAEIEKSGCKLPVDYDLFGRSFDGLDYRFLKPLKDRFPRDYARILEWFPLAELELKRREFSEAIYE